MSRLKFVGDQLVYSLIKVSLIKQYGGQHTEVSRPLFLSLVYFTFVPVWATQ